jgi:hypothetical protein
VCTCRVCTRSHKFACDQTKSVPLAAGAAALVREYYTTGEGYLGVNRDELTGFADFPHGCLLKATLIHSGNTHTYVCRLVISHTRM